MFRDFIFKCIEVWRNSFDVFCGLEVVGLVLIVVWYVIFVEVVLDFLNYEYSRCLVY